MSTRGSFAASPQNAVGKESIRLGCLRTVPPIGELGIGGDRYVSSRQDLGDLEDTDVTVVGDASEMVA
jgi:hypothetical protein